MITVILYLLPLLWRKMLNKISKQMFSYQFFSPWSNELRSKKALSWCSGTISSCPGSYPVDTCPECHVSHLCGLVGAIMMWNRGLCRSPGIYPTSQENLGKFLFGDRLMKAVRPVVTSNQVPCLKMTSVMTPKWEWRKTEWLNQITTMITILYFESL